MVLMDRNSALGDAPPRNIVVVPILGPAAFLASRARRRVPVKVRSSDRQG